MKASSAGVALLAFITGMVLVAAVFYIPVIWLAGPHSSVLPGALQSVVMLVAWLAILGAPAWMAMRTYRWLERRRVAAPRSDGA